MNHAKRKPTLIEALIPIIFLVIFLFVNVKFIFGDAGLDGSNQIILLFSAAVAAIVASRLGFTWEELLNGAVDSIQSAMPAMLILLLIGSLTGTWLLSGIVPALIYYGLQILNPTIFLFAACIICAIVSLGSGSSWTTIATIGIALLGIGKALGIEDGLIAGAIISGAYFGDKMSPLSDTTNLAPAVAGTDLFTHIRYMAFTTIPSISVTLIIFLILGFFVADDSAPTDISAMLEAIDSAFNITPILFIVPVIVFILIIKKVSAIPALLAGTILGGIFAIVFQQDVLVQVAEAESLNWIAIYKGVMLSIYGDISIITDSAEVNDLLSSGGMAGMLGTIWLIMCAMIFGGIMEKSGLLSRITEVIISLANSTGSLIASTAVTCGFFNVTASDQYLAIVVPGRMFAKTYKDRGLMPENLSRTLEDSGTVTSVLVPWNTCGAAQSSVLGVATAVYAPFCFFCIISPLMTILFAYLNIKIRKIPTEQQEIAVEA
ncbi:Na+/H+ antiporter NhaC [Flexithrix dorotheae]|uniref:Na+/H+ antiporter NhaC n=1 Tax=Flexithrix dorotheae TaxID=70993 RepID=UPI00047692E5|nr:Na+/H+ antiporter NhaC [Flexithrix dorotheae]